MDDPNPSSLNAFVEAEFVKHRETLMAVVERVQLGEEIIHSAQAVRAALDKD